MALDINTAIALFDMMSSAKRTIYVDSEEITYIDANQIMNELQSVIDDDAQTRLSYILDLSLTDAESVLETDWNVPGHVSNHVWAYRTNGKYHPAFLDLLRSRKNLDPKDAEELAKAKPAEWAVRRQCKQGDVMVTLHDDGTIRQIVGLQR